VLQRKGNWKEAEIHFRRALTLYESALGRAHPGTVRVMWMLATVLEAEGDLVGARLLYGRAFELTAQSTPRNDPNFIGMKRRLNGLMLKLEPCYVSPQANA